MYFFFIHIITLKKIIITFKSFSIIAINFFSSLFPVIFFFSKHLSISLVMHLRLLLHLPQPITPLPYPQQNLFFLPFSPSYQTGRYQRYPPALPHMVFAYTLTLSSVLPVQHSSRNCCRSSTSTPHSTHSVRPSTNFFLSASCSVLVLALYQMTEEYLLS